MASRLGVRGERDLFGGVVPHTFMATKTITHPLVDVRSHAPPGWSVEFPRRVADVVLDGVSAFTKEDAVLAGRRLLERGPVRVKLATGIAGTGQFVVTSAVDLARALDPIDPVEMSRSGAVVEQNMIDVTTYSVGQVRVADAICTYYGTQHLTTNNRGAEVYGGSEITVARGDFDALLALRLPEDIRLAITQARAYDTAASQCFDGFYASRRNYDVAQGRDTAGLLARAYSNNRGEPAARLRGTRRAGSVCESILRCGPCGRQRARSTVKRRRCLHTPSSIFRQRSARRTSHQICLDGTLCRPAMRRFTCGSRTRTSSAR
jgi:hypothetical protein